MSATGSEAGVTLIEMLVVLAILALIGSVAFSGTPRIVERMAFHQSLSGLGAQARMARARAVRLNEPTAIVPARDSASYRVGTEQEIDLPRGIAVSGGPIRYFPDGTARGARLQITGAGLRGMLTVDPVTGLARTAIARTASARTAEAR